MWLLFDCACVFKRRLYLKCKCLHAHTNHNKYIVFEKHPILYRGFITLRVDGGCFYLQQNFLLFFAFPIFYSLIHISELCLTSHHYLCIISHIYLYHLFLFCYPALHQHYYPRVHCHFITEMRMMTLWKLNDHFENLNLECETTLWNSIFLWLNESNLAKIND